MNSEKNNDYIICLSPSATEEQIAEWEKMVEKLEERSRNTDGE